MSIELIPNAELRLVEGNQFDGNWTSSGNDPAYVVKLPVFRTRFILLCITAAAGSTADCQLYIDRGRGFREEDTWSAPVCSRTIIVVDAGSFGVPTKFRFDPASSPLTFRLSVHFFGSELELERHLNSVDVAISEASIVKLPRFKLRLPKLTRRKKENLKRYLDETYRLASEIAPIPHSDATEWLSIIVPVYNTNPTYLDDLLTSFRAQDQRGVELILVDDGSTSTPTITWLSNQKELEGLRLIRNAANGGIAVATNEALKVAKGTWATFLDHDDRIAPHALKVIKQALDARPDLQFLYTDEVVTNQHMVPTGLMLKPAYDPVLLTGVNYINHFSVYRMDRLREIGFLRLGFDGSQDYDLVLRYLASLSEHQVAHLSYPAYWWRCIETSYSHQFLDRATNNARKALVDRFTKDGVAVSVGPALTKTLHRVHFDSTQSQKPKVSIIIPSRDSYKLIKTILEGLYEKTSYPRFEILVVDNGSTDPTVDELYDLYRNTNDNFKVIRFNESFNFSRSVNKGIAESSGELLLLLNNDVEVLHPDWLQEMVSCFNFPNVGIVGPKLLFPNGTIQHAGVIVGFGGLAGHWFLGKPGNFGGPMNRLHLRNTLTAVTGAAMLVSRSCWHAVGEWDEKNFEIAYNDIDYCLRAQRAGYNVLWSPFATLIHHESISRGYEIGEEKLRRFEREKANLQLIHETESHVDSASHPAFGRNSSVPDIAPPFKLHGTRSRRVDPE
ncbi:glycosyltransferase family 2 protein [Agrobacterium rosae]